MSQAHAHPSIYNAHTKYMSRKRSNFSLASVFLSEIWSKGGGGGGGGEQMRKSNIYHIYIDCDKSQITLFYLTLSSDDGD